MAVNRNEKENKISLLPTNHSRRTKTLYVNPCERKPSIEMEQLMEVDFKNDQVYGEKLISLFDHLDQSMQDYFGFFAARGEKKDLDCVPMRDEISKIEYMISQRDGSDPKVKALVISRYLSVAYGMLDQTMETKREYYSMVAVSGIFMNISGKHFFSAEQGKELAYIYERIRDDYQSFLFHKDQKEIIDKNGMADRILLRDWLGSLD